MKHDIEQRLSCVISYSSVLSGFRTVSRVSNSLASRSDPTQPTRDRNKGEGIHTANPCLPFSSVHNTGAGQIGQDLRDDIGTRTSERARGVTPPAEQGESGRGGGEGLKAEGTRERKREKRDGKEGIGGEEGIEQLNRKRHNGPGWLWRRVIKWVPHSHTAA